MLFFAQIAGWIRGSQAKEVAKLKTTFHETMGIGVELNHSEAQWRQLVRQAWLLGFLSREIAVGKGHNMMRSYTFCTFSLSPHGREFIEAPHQCPLSLPGEVRLKETHGGKEPLKTATRKGKGCHALPEVSGLCRNTRFNDMCPRLP